jgi:lysophospholipase L1-like esterase
MLVNDFGKGIRAGLSILLFVCWFALPVQADETLFALAGDSTVASGNGWGDSLADFLPASITVNNQAANGRSTKSFINEGRWQTTLNLSPDYVFIQFGHNDQKLDDSSRGTYAVDDPANVSPGALDLYRGNLRRMVDDVVALGATPILVTPAARRATPYDSAQAQIDRNSSQGSSDSFGNHYSLLDYADAVKAVAAEKKVTVIDLNQLSLDLYSEMIGNGQDISTLGPAGDNTHFNATGAVAIAELVAKSIPAEFVPEPSAASLSMISLILLGTLRRHAR